MKYWDNARIPYGGSAAPHDPPLDPPLHTHTHTHVLYLVIFSPKGDIYGWDD